MDPDPDALWSDSKIEEDLNVVRELLRGLMKTTLNGRVGTVADLDFGTRKLAVRLDACSWDESIVTTRRVNIFLASSITQEEEEEVRFFDRNNDEGGLEFRRSKKRTNF